MKNVSIQGIIPPILTPMNADESINEQELRSQVNREIEAGVHGIFAFGTNGEAYALSAAEKDRVLEVVIEETNHRVPVYAGTGCITTKETIEMSKKAAAMGADVLSIITPYFAAASQDELYAHYMAVAEAVDLPIVLYNIPARTGNALSPATVAKLAKNIEQTRGLDKEFSVLSGNDSLILPALVFGGKGGIAGCANVFPGTMVEIYEAYMAGDLERAMRVQDSIRPLRAVFQYGNPNTIIKIAAGLLGYPVGSCRKPFCQLSDQGMEALKKALELCKANGLR